MNKAIISLLCAGAVSLAGCASTKSTVSSESKQSDSAAGAASSKAPSLYYQGHASVRITTAENKVIYVDPFTGDGYDVGADLILVTHGHLRKASRCRDCLSWLLARRFRWSKGF